MKNYGNFTSIPWFPSFLGSLFQLLRFLPIIGKIFASFQQENRFHYFDLYNRVKRKKDLESEDAPFLQDYNRHISMFLCLIYIIKIIMSVSQGWGRELNEGIHIKYQQHHLANGKGSVSTKTHCYYQRYPHERQGKWNHLIKRTGNEFESSVSVR